VDRLYVGDRVSRPELRGQPCRVVCTWRRRGKHNVLVEFADGSRAVCPVRCIRKHERRKQDGDSAMATVWKIRVHSRESILRSNVYFGLAPSAEKAASLGRARAKADGVEQACVDSVIRLGHLAFDDRPKAKLAGDKPPGREGTKRG